MGAPHIDNSFVLYCEFPTCVGVAAQTVAMVVDQSALRSLPADLAASKADSLVDLGSRI